MSQSRNTFNQDTCPKHFRICLVFSFLLISVFPLHPVRDDINVPCRSLTLHMGNNICRLQSMLKANLRPEQHFSKHIKLSDRREQTSKLQPKYEKAQSLSTSHVIHNVCCSREMSHQIQADFEKKTPQTLEKVWCHRQP